MRKFNFAIFVNFDLYMKIFQQKLFTRKHRFYALTARASMDNIPAAKVPNLQETPLERYFEVSIALLTAVTSIEPAVV